MQFARKYIWFTNLELHSKVSDIPYHILERLAWLQCHEVLTTFSNGRMLVFWMQNSCSCKTLAHAFLCCSSETPPTSKIQHFHLTQASSGRGNNSILKHWPNCCLPSTCWWFKQTNVGSSFWLEVWSQYSALPIPCPGIPVPAEQDDRTQCRLTAVLAVPQHHLLWAARGLFWNKVLHSHTNHSTITNEICFPLQAQL